MAQGVVSTCGMEGRRPSLMHSRRRNRDLNSNSANGWSRDTNSHKMIPSYKVKGETQPTIILGSRNNRGMLRSTNHSCKRQQKSCSSPNSGFQVIAKHCERHHHRLLCSWESATLYPSLPPVKSSAVKLNKRTAQSSQKEMQQWPPSTKKKTKKQKCKGKEGGVP